MNAEQPKHDPKSIINILTIILGILIVYSAVITFAFIYTSNDLEDTKSQILGLELQNEALEKRLSDN